MAKWTIGRKADHSPQSSSAYASSRFCKPVVCRARSWYEIRPVKKDSLNDSWENSCNIASFFKVDLISKV